MEESIAFLDFTKQQIELSKLIVKSHLKGLSYQEVRIILECIGLIAEERSIIQ